MDADAVAVDAPCRFVGALRGAPAVVAQHQLIGGQADGLGHDRRVEPFGQGGSRGVGGDCRCAAKDRLTQLLNPDILGRALPQGAGEELMLIEQLRHQSPHRTEALHVARRLGTHAVAHRLPQERVRLFAADDAH